MYAILNAACFNIICLKCSLMCCSISRLSVMLLREMCIRVPLTSFLECDPEHVIEPRNRGTPALITNNHRRMLNLMTSRLKLKVSMPFVHVFNRVMTLFFMKVRPKFPLSGKYRSLLLGISDPRAKYSHQSCVEMCPVYIWSGVDGKTGALTSGRGSRYFFLTATI